MMDAVTIPVVLFDGTPISVEIVSESKDSLFCIDENEAYANGESVFQLREGCFYEYRLPDGYYLEPSELVTQFKFNKSGGRITPNIYVGNLAINILNSDLRKCGELKLEIQSSKTSYRKDYRSMLVDITEKCTDLILHYNAPVSQRLTVDFENDSTVLYQRFAFIKSVLESDEFQEAMQRIISSPVTAWEETQTQKDVRALKRISNKCLRQFIASPNRVQLAVDGPLANVFKTVPRKIHVSRKETTVDCSENRFIKYALEAFLATCNDFITHTSPNTRVNKEARLLESKVNQFLNHDVFKEVSSVTSIPFNSPVLQRKEGYREIFRTWLMFDLAAKLIWQGGDDVYSGGKKDIALLYEYWVFFKLLDIVKEVFRLEPKTIDTLIQQTKDGVGLQLRQGKYLPIDGVYESATRKLNIEFSYNRTFPGNSVYPSGGSWTRNLRPDYTLSIWPFGITQEEAEHEELIVHLHFDAKYKIDEITNVFHADENLEGEKQDQRRGAYKRADLLKMHTYKDAIRRSAGAYILYPGSDYLLKGGFHELLPGVGAFALKPSKNYSGISNISKFLNDVLEHFLNRASQREEMSFRTYEIHKNKSNESLHELLPELIGKNRDLLPMQTNVLVAYYKSLEHYNWILRTGLYNARAKDVQGSLAIGPSEAGARFLLLHTKGETLTNRIFKIIEKPRILSREDLIDLGYPSRPTQEFYMVYAIDPSLIHEFDKKYWQITYFENFTKGPRSALPFTVSLSQLMKAIAKK